MKTETMFTLLLALVLVGCSHGLEVKNLDKYSRTAFSINQMERPNVGLVSSEGGDISCSKLVKEVASQLQRQANVTYPCDPGTGKDPEYIVDIKVKSEYKGSFWNWFPISWPGFLIFTPAWNGFAYDANYDFDVTISKDGKQIDSFKEPVTFDIRHAELDRTWIEAAGWLFWTAPALVFGLFNTGYDTDVSPQLVEKVEKPLGEYMAARILQSIITKR